MSTVFIPHKCEKCNKKYDDPDANYCIKCGEELIYHSIVEELLDEPIQKTHMWAILKYEPGKTIKMKSLLGWWDQDEFHSDKMIFHKITGTIDPNKNHDQRALFAKICGLTSIYAKDVPTLRDVLKSSMVRSGLLSNLVTPEGKFNKWMIFDRFTINDDGMVFEQSDAAISQQKRLDCLSQFTDM